MAHQRILERAGWAFWRCFASTWRLHRAEVIAELVDRLKRMGIEPLGPIDWMPVLVEKRVIKSPSEAIAEVAAAIRKERARESELVREEETTTEGYRGKEGQRG